MHLVLNWQIATNNDVTYQRRRQNNFDFLTFNETKKKGWTETPDFVASRMSQDADL